MKTSNLKLVSSDGHRILSPSGSDSWIPCPGSISFVAFLLAAKKLKKEKRNADPHSPSNEGTRAHLVLSTALENGVTAEEARHMIPDADLTTSDMADYVQTTINWVADYFEENPNAKLFVEHYVDTEPYTGTAETDGTSDIIIVNLDKKELVVFDFKYGSGIAVHPSETYQLILYGLGALSEYVESQFEKITLGIGQPRHHATRDIELVSTPVKEFVKHSGLISKSARIALDPEAYKNKDNFGPGEKQCKWCDAAPFCDPLAEYMLNLAVEDFSSEELQPVTEEDLKVITSPETRAFVATHAKLFQSWITTILADNTDYMLAGNEIPGFKLVRKSANRQLTETDPDKLAKLLGLKKQEVIETKVKLLAMTKIEKLAKQNEMMKEFNSVIYKPEGDLVIAPASDRREEVSPFPIEDDSTEDEEAIQALLASD